MDIRQLTRSNSAAIPALQMLSTGVLLGAIFLGNYGWLWLVPVLVYLMTGGLGVTMTNHRFHTHKSFKFRVPFGMKKFFEYLFSFLASIGGTGSTIGWVYVHILHHLHADTPQDPHSPLHRKWTVLFGSYNHGFDVWKVRRLYADRFHRVMHDYYFAILAGWAVLLSGISWVWLGSFDLVILVVVIPMAFQIWVSNLSNYFNHSRGYRNFNSNDNSRNSWWLAIIAWGEGWHNLHHMFPWCANFGIRWWEFDITYQLIRVFGKDARLLGPVHKEQLL